MELGSRRLLRILADHGEDCMLFFVGWFWMARLFEHNKTTLMGENVLHCLDKDHRFNRKCG